MKRTLLGGLVLALALFTAQVGTSEAATNIKYDGYCDGVSLTFDVFSGLASGTATGCANGAMMGTVADVFTQGPALTMGFDDVGTYGPIGTIVVIRADRTWTYYRNDGNGIYAFSNGTWSPGIPLGTTLGTNSTGAGLSGGR